MVETYDYKELFEEHETVHLIIVNSSATVTGVTDSAPTITGADFVLTEDNIDGDTMDLAECLNSAQNLKFGSLEPSKFEIDIFNQDISITSLKDVQIDAYLYFDEDSSTLFQVGEYVVKFDEYSDDRQTRHLTAFDILQDLYDYDVTAWYNKAYDGVDTVTIYELRTSLIEWLNTPSNQKWRGDTKVKGGGYDYPIEYEDVELINDDFPVEYSIESDVITFGFVMEGLLEANGVFGHIARDGSFVHVSLDTFDVDPKRTFTEEDAFEAPVYEDYHVWGIGFVAIWDRNNTRLAYEGDSAYSHPSIYNIINSFVFTNDSNLPNRIEDIKTAAKNLRDKVTHMWYYPFELDCAGNLVYEVGDRVNFIATTYDEETDGVDDEEPIDKNMYSYILNREFHGIQEFTDLISATGDRKQPRYKVKQDSRWHKGDSAKNSTDTSDGTGEVVDNAATMFIKYCRNTGIRFLLEPSQVSVKYVKELGNHHVELKWKDPSDITNYKPEPQTWAGTIVVRSTSGVPVHPWDDCAILVDSTTRDAYLEEPYIDNTIETNKKYYYGIFPYSIIDDSDPEHIIKRYRFTKVVSVNTQSYLTAPIITEIGLGSIAPWDGSETTLLWSGNSNKMTVKVADNHIVFTLYTGNTVTYTFNAAQGTSASDISNISIGFLVDTEDEIAKPSLVYNNGDDTYSYNQEQPSEAQMADIYTWLSAGL